MCMTFLCMVALRNKMVAPGYLPSFINANSACTESWILEKVSKFTQQFSKPGVEVKTWKNGKSLKLFWKLQQVLHKWNFFVLVKSYSILHGCQGKSFIPVFFKVSIDHLFDNLESEKVNHCFGKGLEKVLNFGWKICMNPVQMAISVKKDC